MGPHPSWGAGTPPGTSYPAPRQAGLGYSPAAPVFDAFAYNGDSEPVYLWNNAGTGCHERQTRELRGAECTNPDSATNDLVGGRDYFLETLKPGYSKYPCPHPLTLSQLAPPPNPQVR